jgi:hypothetical protein
MICAAPCAHLKTFKMKRILTFAFILFAFQACQSQEIKQNQVTPEFRKFVNDVLVDTVGFTREFPKPPAVTDEVLVELQREFKDDSTKFYFEQLSNKNLKERREYEKPLKYLSNYHHTITLLALSVHSDPDIRVIALKALNSTIRMRVMVCAQQSTYDQFDKDDIVIGHFLVHVLESNPLIIPGSENSTIHGFYISNILWILDLVTKENIVGEKQLSEWYKNDLQFEQAVLKWKNHKFPASNTKEGKK